MKINVKIPKDLGAITLAQYKHYLDIQSKNKDDKFLQAKMIEIFCDISLSNVYKLKYNDSLEIISILTKMFEQKPQLVKKFKIGKTEYGFNPSLDDLTLGEYMDLDTYIGDWTNIEKAMNVLYRPITASLGSKYSIKEYEAKENLDILKMPMDAVNSSIFFLSFRDGLIESYDELFGQQSRGSLDRVSQFAERYGWFNSLFGLAGGDITKFKYITKLNVHECLLMLEFMKAKNELESTQIKSKFK
tara:strand:- start:5700 stop:6434 length:735 start_codon:yes stop_codon:yes gene_type:complete